MSDDTLREFVADLAVFAQVAAKRHGAAWLCSLRSKMRLERAEFERLALAAHQAGLVELSRADLTDCADARYLEESALAVPRSDYVFHFLREVF